MAIKIWDGSKWAISSQIKVWDGSAWKENTNANVFIWTGSTWQKIHPGVYLDQANGYYALSIDTTPSPFGNAQARVHLYANGKIQTDISDSVTGTQLLTSEDWLLTGANSEYDVFVNNFSGDTLDFGSGPTDGTRVSLSDNVSFSLTQLADGTLNSQFDLILCANNSSGNSSNVEIQNAAVTLSVSVGLGP